MTQKTHYSQGELSFWIPFWTYVGFILFLAFMAGFFVGQAKSEIATENQASVCILAENGTDSPDPACPSY